MATKAEFICLKCVLWECDEDSDECLFKVTGQVVSRKAKIARTRVAIERTKADLERLERNIDRLRVNRQVYDRQRYLLRKSEKVSASQGQQPTAGYVAGSV